MADDIWAWPSTRENIPYKIIELEQCYDLDGDGSWDDYGYYSSYVDHYYYSNVVNTGVDSIDETSGTVEVERFDLSGRRLSTPVMGINIVKYSDGSVKKVLVK